MIVSWIHNRTGPHEVDTETADLKALRAARRALGGLDDLHYLIWRSGLGVHTCAERTARELDGGRSCNQGAQGRAPQHRTPTTPHPPAAPRSSCGLTIPRFHVNLAKA